MIRSLSQIFKSNLNYISLKNHNILLNELNLPRLFSISSIKSKEYTAEERRNNIIEKEPSKDRRIKISVETSIRYLQSAAFKEAYGNEPVWKIYRRNFKGSRIPRTRKMCIRNDVISTGSPCPICRDEYLVIDYTNIDLLKQFISEVNGKILPTEKTGVCQQQQIQLLVAYTKAKDFGLITFDVPFREYDYSEYNLY